MKVVILSGTSRKGNNTIRVAKAIDTLHKSLNHESTIVDFRSYDLPFFNGEPVDDAKPTPFRENLLNAWAEADLVYILSPEYNWLISPELANMANHYSGGAHKALYDNKVFAFVGVSSGIGGRLPTMQLSSVFEKLIFYLGGQAVCSPNKFESHYTPSELDENGQFIKESGYATRLKSFVEYSARLCNRFTGAA
ncbi:MAG: NAD(P)H-dependent oxidoreductase [Bacteroidetes bacterium]|jgi:chromate reductase|nr:NAD(P)H-dependent oxidoreductase [Bacteroidota bacterium]